MENTKTISMRVPKELLKNMSKVRTEEGITITFQFLKGAELYLNQKSK